MYSSELICNILNYLDNNIYSEITIDMISSIFCYDKYYIMKKFKKEIGISIINYLNYMKIYNSLKCYKYNDSILKIAFDNGFNSLEYYSEIFKKVIGVSPMNYKKFVRYDISLTENDSEIILNSILKLESFKRFCITYKSRVKPKEQMVKKLSIYK